MIVAPRPLLAASIMNFGVSVWISVHHLIECGLQKTTEHHSKEIKSIDVRIEKESYTSRIFQLRQMIGAFLISLNRRSWGKWSL